MAGTPQRIYQEHYREVNATLREEQSVPGVRRQTITRFWPLDLPPFKMQAAIAELDLWTSEKNNTPRRWVENPGVNPRAGDSAPFTMPGIYRLVANRMARPGQEKPGIYQELAYGYMLPPPNDPGTDPQTGDPVDAWAALDREAVVLLHVKFNRAAAKDVMGVGYSYTLCYHNVALDQYGAFSAAMMARDTIDLSDPDAQPRFYSGNVAPGVYRFIHCSNKPDEDGSACDVFVEIADAAVKNQAIQVLRNWQQWDWKTYWSGVPAIPYGMLPNDIPAVDDPRILVQKSVPPSPGAIQDTQTTLASTFTVSGISLDQSTGKYHIEVTQKQAQPWFKVLPTPTQIAGVLALDVMLVNQTGAWVDATLSALGAAGYAVSYIHIDSNEFKLFTGRIPARMPNEKRGDYAYYQKRCQQVTVGEEKYPGCIMRVETFTVWREYKQPNATNVRANFGDLGPGGYWKNIGAGWFECKKVMYLWQRWRDYTTIAMGADAAPGWTPWHNIYKNAAANDDDSVPPPTTDTK